jgi:hypothetical protein
MFIAFDIDFPKDFVLGPLEELDEERCDYIGYVRAVHSVVFENFMVSKENTIYSYSSEPDSNIANYRYVKFEFDSKPQKQFVEVMQRAVPGLSFIERGTTEEFEPNISKNDPRNPYGFRYKPHHPHGYVVAYTKGLKNNPRAIDDAIDAAKHDGTLPRDWRLAAAGISRMKPPPGVPTMFDSFFK